MLSFSFNGIRKDYVHMLRGRKRPPWPTLARNILTVPGRPGGYLQGTEIQPRIIEVPIAIRGQNIGDLQKLKEDLASWLVTDEPKELVFDDEPDRTYYAVVDETIDFDEIAYLGQGTIRFLCPDPYKYGPLRTQTIAVPPASFSRNSVAYLSDGTQVVANQPRFEQGGILIEEGTVNLVPNPSFEIDSNSDGLADQWIVSVRGTGDSNRTHDVSRAPSLFHGLYAQRVEITGGVTNSQVTGLGSAKVNITPGNVYVATAYIKASVANKVVIVLRWEDSSNNYISENSSSQKAGTSVTRLTVTATAPPNAARVSVYIQGINQIGEWFEVDAVQLEQKPYATSFVDGTRQPETLTLTTDGVLNPEEGTIECWVYENDITRWGYIWDTGGTNRFYCAKNNSNYIVVGINNGTVFSTTMPSVGWHLVTLKWSGNFVALYVDGILKVIKTIESPVSFDGVAALIIGGRYNNIDHWNGLIGKIRLSRIARSDTEILDAYQNGFTVDEYTTAYLPFDGSLEIQTPTIVNNEGTAETYPTFTAYVKQPITFLDIISPDSYMRVGQPYATDQTPVDGDKPVMKDEMTTTTGWGAATSVLDGVVQGTMVSDGNRFVVQSYGPTFNGWGGPALKKSLPNPVQDFRVHALVDFKSSANGTGRIEIYGLDVANNIVFRMTIHDFWKNSVNGRAFWEIGPNTDLIFSTYGKKSGALSDYYGSLAIERKGKRWKVYTARRTGPTNKPGVYVDYVEKTFIDTKNQYTAPLAQIQVHIGIHLGYGPINHMSINHVFVYDLHDPLTDQVPYIAYPDDVLQFDHKNAVVYRNGEPILWAKDFGARFFPLAPGATELAVNPSDAAIVEIEYRPRYK